jgi:signal transduction histidine kinase
MADPGFARLVSLACHDLRTPLATVVGFAKTLSRTGALGEREARFVALIEAAGGQIADLLDRLALAARIEGGRYEPDLVEADTLELAASADGRIGAAGRGATVRTDAAALRRSLEALALAALVHGGASAVAWRVEERELALAPVSAGARAVVTGEAPHDLGALLARRVIEALGGSLAVDGETLRVTLPRSAPA